MPETTDGSAPSVNPVHLSPSPKAAPAESHPITQPAKALVIALLAVWAIDVAIGLMETPVRPMGWLAAPGAAVLMVVGLLMVRDLAWLGAVLGLGVCAWRLIPLVTRKEEGNGINLGATGVWFVAISLIAVAGIAAWIIKVQLRLWREDGRRLAEREANATAGPQSVEAVRVHLKERDEPCPGCGYNLRGLSADRCPECSRPVRLVLWRPEPGAVFYRLAVACLAMLAIEGVVKVWYVYLTIRGLLEWSKTSGAPRPAIMFNYWSYLGIAVIQVGIGIAAAVILLRTLAHSRQGGPVGEVARGGMSRKTLWLGVAFLVTVHMMNIAQLLW